MGRLGSTWLASALLCASVATAADADPVAAAISAELDALMNPEVTTVQGATIAFGDSLREFYSRREFRAAWSSAAPRQQLLKALADSYDDGLDPEPTITCTLLRKLATQVTAPDATDTLKAQYDILLTEALVRLGYHLSFGKVDPETFDAQWNYGRTLPRTDVPREIEDAIASATVYDRVAALKPTHRLYTRLKQELARFRAVEKEDGWSQRFRRAWRSGRVTATRGFRSLRRTAGAQRRPSGFSCRRTAGVRRAAGGGRQAAISSVTGSRLTGWSARGRSPN